MALTEASPSADRVAGIGVSNRIADLDGAADTVRQLAADARTLVFSLQIGGWSEIQAGNLVAFLLGIRPVQTGWQATEIEHLRSLKVLVETGRIAH